MEVLQLFPLPHDFKPVAETCSKFEDNVFNLFHEVYCIKKNKIDELYQLIINDTENFDDIDFIVNLQNDLGIADNSLETYGEWGYVFSIMQTLESYREVNSSFEEYIQNSTSQLKSLVKKQIQSCYLSLKDLYYYYSYDIDFDHMLKMHEITTDKMRFTMDDLYFVDKNKLSI